MKSLSNTPIASLWYGVKVATVYASLILALITGGLAFMCVFGQDTWVAGLILGFICLTAASFSSNLSASLEEEGRIRNRPDEEP